MFRTFLSWRYLFARRTNLIGIVGIFVGVGALIMILSIMTGFLDEARRTVRGTLSDLIIEPDQVGEVPTPPAAILARVRSDARVRGASAELIWGGIITQRDRPYERLFSSPIYGKLVAVQLVGVDVSTPLRFGWPAIRLGIAATGGIAQASLLQDDFDATHFLAALAEDPTDPLGRRGWPVANPLFPFARPAKYKPAGRPAAAIVVGQQLAYNLGLRPGDEIEIRTVVHDPDTGEWKGNNRDFVVAGTFRSRDNETDTTRIYLQRGELADFIGGTMQFSQVLVRLRDYDSDAERVRDDLRARLAEEGLIAGGLSAVDEVKTWEEFRGNLLGAIRNERFLMGIMLSLVLVVAGFTIFAILSMMVTEKRRDVGILCALGATPRGVLQTFLMIAFWDAFIGSITGAVAGTWAAVEIDSIERWLSGTFGVQIFDRNVYLFDHIPSIVEPLWVATIVLGAFTCALLFAAVPAWRASRLDPLDALRYE